MVEKMSTRNAFHDEPQFVDETALREGWYSAVHPHQGDEDVCKTGRSPKKPALIPMTTTRMSIILAALMELVILTPVMVVLWVGSSVRRLSRGYAPFLCITQWSMGEEPTSTSNNKTVQEQPSGTAFSSAFFRYHGYLEGLNSDHLIGRFLPWYAHIVCRFCVCISQIGLKRLIDWSSCGFYGYSICATNHLDETLVTLCESGAIECVVNLGAGLDTRLFRLLKNRPEITSFEVDIATTQALKRLLIERHFTAHERMNEPKLVSVDFSTEKLMDNLIKAGFNHQKRTLFIMECVSFFLSQQDLQDLFEQLPKGSIVAFDYMEDTWSTEERQRRAPLVFGAASSSKCKRAGEPLKFGLGHEETPEKVFGSWGLQVHKHLDPRAYSEAYLKGTGHISSEKCHLCWLVVGHSVCGKASSTRKDRPADHVATGV